MEASSGGHNMPKIMTFRPTWDEFKDFNQYIEYVESQGAHKAGICKIIPPKEWVPRKEGYDNINILIPSPITQVVHGKQGLYTQFNVQRKPISVKDFEKLANSNTYKTPRHADYEDLERRYWKNITFVNPIYGADVSGSITDVDQHSWNISKLGSILDCLGNDYGISIEGVNTAYLYFGMWKTTFAWHTEDMDLYSINYVHFGAAKRWYAIPPEHGRRLERLAQGFFTESYDQCPAFLRHKMSLISPTILKRYSIPYDTIVQEAGEIIITFPYGYHSGFNQGFNCAESTNFASRRWIEYGKRCQQCHCRRDSVKIDMGAFVKRFQPKLYDLWKVGKDYGPHPEDDRSKLYNHHHHDLVSSTSPSKRVKSCSKKQHITSTEDQILMRQARGTIKRCEAADSLTEAMAMSSQDVHSIVKKTKVEGVSNGAEKEETADYKYEQSNDIDKTITSCSENAYSTATTSSCSDMDAPTDISEAPTDVSDAMTDVETEIRGPSNDVVKPHKSAQTHTGPCKSKKRKSMKGMIDDPSLLQVDLSWAKALTRLWKFNKQDFEAETRYNTKMSQRAPFCTVCSVLNSRDNITELNKTERTRTPRTSVPVLPPSSFMSAADWDLQTPRTKPCKPRALLICTECKVCVHDTCYGVKFLPDGPTNWKCSRCAIEQTTAECVLCCLRGGALKPTSSGNWAHIVCAVANTEVLFRSVNQREPIVTSNITKQRITLKCMYCGVHTFMNGKDRYGKCVQCSIGQCSKSFHLTCARAAGLRIDIGNWPFRIHITCSRHVDNSSHKGEEKKDRPVLNTKDEVYAKHKNGRYYKGEVEGVSIQTYYCVLFDDNSTSRDLFPEDIINYQPRDGPPPLGCFVNVKWPDDLTYNGHFQGARQVELFAVKFEDGSQVQIERDQLYSIHEQLPTHIQKKLSYATEMKNDVFYRKDRDLLTETRTRGVQVNYNYKWDYAPKLYLK